jgi:hypothetical protein
MKSNWNISFYRANVKSLPCLGVLLLLLLIIIIVGFFLLLFGATTGSIVW